MKATFTWKVLSTGLAISMALLGHLSWACAATDMTSQSMFIPRGGETTG